jgi:hypothetical protein
MINMTSRFKDKVYNYNGAGIIENHYAKTHGQSELRFWTQRSCCLFYGVASHGSHGAKFMDKTQRAG